jgi:hypothetical protein
VFKEEDWASDPVRKALRHDVRVIGQLAFAAGGNRLLERLCERQWDEPDGDHRTMVVKR